MGSESLSPCARLRAIIDKQIAAGDVPSAERLAEYYARFAERLGPGVLSKLSGEELLVTMHEHGSSDSLVYSPRLESLVP